MPDQTKKVVEGKVEAKEFRAENFAKVYQKLCEEMGFRIVVTPVWIARDDGTWSLQLQTSIGKLPQMSNR